MSALFLLHGLIFSTWISRIPSAQARFHLSTGLLGLLLLCSAAGSITLMPIAGMLVSRLGSRRMVQMASLCFASALLGPVLSTNPWQLAVALFYFGAMAGSMNVSMNEQAVLVESALRKPLLSSCHACFSLGGMLGAFFGGLAADHNISLPQHLIAAAVILGVGVRIASGNLLESTAQPIVQSSRLVLHLAPAILSLGLLAFCAGIGEGAMADWSGIYLHTELGTSLGQAAFGYGVFSLAMLVGRLLGDRLTQAFGSQWSLNVGYQVAAAGLSVSLLTRLIPVTLVGFAIAGLGLSVVIPNIFRRASRVEGLAAGYGLAATSTMGYLGFLSGPPAIGGLAQLFSLRMALLFVILAMLLGVVLARRLSAETRVTWTSEVASVG